MANMNYMEKKKFQFLTLQKRLKEERLFVKNEKDQINILNEKVESLSQNLFCTEWKNRQQWNNVDRLITAKAKPSDCSATSRFIDSVKFEDSYGYLNYEDSKYGEFILTLKDNPKLIALILNYCDVKRIQTSCRQITNLIISTLYGNCTLVKEELIVLQILKELANLQILPCEDLISFISGKRSTENAFACLLAKFSEILFSSKLYLTAALHGAVMQVIVGDREFLDYEVSKVLNRLTPKATVEKFGQPSMASTNNKIKEHVKNLQSKLVKLCKMFLKNLFDKTYCFPNSLRWAIGQLYKGMISTMKLPPVNAKAIIGYMLMSYFICPAIINPEPYGINSDADISEIARHNLWQVASIFRSLALLECGMKDEKLQGLLEQLDKGVIMSYVTELLVGCDMDIFETNNSLSSDIVRSSILITEHDLRTLINCLKLLQTYNIRELAENGLVELLDSLPNPPPKWRKQKTELIKSVTMPPNLNTSSQSLTPTQAIKTQGYTNPSPTFGFSSVKDIDDGELNELREDLNTYIGENEVVLVIQLYNTSEVYPGMIPEEKVLGLGNDDSQPFNIIDTSTEDQQRRTSCYLVDALRDTCVDCEPNINDPNNLSNPSTSSNFSTDSEANMKANTSEIIRFEDLPSVVPNLVVSTDNHDKSQSSNVPVDTLLNFHSDDDNGNGNSDDEIPPALPVKKRNQSLFSPEPELQVQMTSSNPFATEPLIDVENETYNTNLKTHKHNMLNQNVFDLNNQLNDASLLGGDGDLNFILQGASVAIPESKPTDTFPNWSPVQTSEVGDPWGSLKSNETITNSFEGFENDFNKSVIPRTRKLTPPANVRYSLAPEALATHYNEYHDSILEEHKRLSDVKAQENEDKDDLDDKTKRTSNAWIRDKISNRIANTIKSRMKSDNTLMKKDSYNDRLHRNLTHSHTDLITRKMIPVPEVPRSKSISSTGSEEYAPDDGVEAILAKYRNMKDTSHELNNSFEISPAFCIDDPNMKPFDADVIFDDEFKFYDAKKKLRSVLSKSDEVMSASNAMNFDELLTTFLQVKLAESINLQDRFAAAQCHEALRSIKQLPNGSYDNLIEELEKDYEQRTRYISYLVQSKQGLLSTISHLEQISSKLQRDRVVCSKYFTTASVRSYLEHPEKKRDIQTFALDFVSNKLADEKCALLNEFLLKLHKEMLKDRIWMYCNEEEVEQLEVATERAIISKIYNDAFHPNSIADSSNDHIFHEHIKYLSKVITLSHPALQIPKTYQKEAPWSSAQTELLMVNAYKTAADKLACIHRCCVTIMNLLSMASAKQAPGADDFVPVLVYVVLQANPPNLLSTKQYVNTFYEARLNGEEYYCWMQFCAAIEFIKTIRTPNS